jgi:hypothetical protein
MRWEVGSIAAVCWGSWPAGWAFTSARWRPAAREGVAARGRESAGYARGQTVDGVFGAASAFPNLATQSLLEALQGGGGPGTEGTAKILLRAAVAALLNAAYPDVPYPRTAAGVIADADGALASNDRNTMLALASAMDNDNNLGCPLT